jgi:uncharacterized protein
MWKLGESILNACAAVTYRRPWLVLGLSILVTIAAAYASTKLTISTSTENFLAADLAFRQNERAYAAVFPREQSAVVLVEAPSPDRAAAAAQALAKRLRERTAFFTNVEIPGDDPYFEDNAFLFLEVERLRALAAQIEQAQPAFSVLQKDPTLRGLAQLMTQMQAGAAAEATPPQFTRMLSELARTTAALAEGRPASMQWSALFDIGADLQGNRKLVLATPVADNNSFQRFGAALSALRSDIAAVTSEHPGATMRVTGEPALQHQELNDAFSGALYASGLSFVLVALSLVFGIRSGRLIAALLLTMFIGSVWTTGLAALSVGRLNLISIAFLVLFFGLGVDFGTHLGLRYLEAIRKGAPFTDALKEAMTEEGPSIALSALCAALAFLSFVPTVYTGLAEFGIISALGMLVAVVMTFTVQPALMALMPPRPVRSFGVGIGIGRFIQRHSIAILGAAAVVTVAAGFLIPQARIDVNPLNLQNPNTEPVRTYQDLASDPQTSPYALNVLAPNLEAARALAPKLAAVEGVAGVRWVESFVPANQEPKLKILSGLMGRLTSGVAGADKKPPPDDAALRQAYADLRKASAALASTAPAGSNLRSEAQRFTAALSQYAERRGAEPAALRALDEALLGGFGELTLSLGAKLSVSQPVTLEDLPDDLRRDWVAPDGRVRLQAMPARDITSPEALNAFAERVQAVAPRTAGTPAILTGAGDAILRAFAQAIAYTTIAIVVVTAVVRRRFSDVLLVLAPLAVASIWTIAASALLDLPFNFANVIVIPLLIGLGVASSIHIVARARELEKKAPGGIGGGVMETSTSLAVLVAQLNTVAAFATLAISEHRGLYSMGLLLGLSILFVLIASLVVLPAAMVAIERWRRPAEAGP